MLKSSRSKGFFKSLKRSIRNRLAVTPILRAWNKSSLRSNIAVYVPKQFWD